MYLSLLLSTISAPNGIKASCANLKHCKPIGIPRIVIHQNSPIITEVIANSQPNNRIHNILSKNELVLLEYCISFPKGANIRAENLKHWIPNGMPKIVMHKIIPLINQSNDSKMPPNIIHKMLAIIFISKINSFS